MKKLLRQIAAASLAASMAITGTIMSPVSAEENVTDAAVTAASGAVNETGMYGLYDYAYWNDGRGSIETNFKLRGAFDFTFNDVSSALCMTGNLFVKKIKDADLNDIEMREKPFGKPVIEYRAKVETDGDYTLGAYGWFDKQRREFAVIDDWGDWNPADNAGTLEGSIEVDGAVYDVYKNYIGSFDDPTPIYTIKSIRREKISTENGYAEGKISLYEHFKEWEKLGIVTDEPYEIMFAAEAVNATGTIHVLKNDLYYLVDEENDPGNTVGTGPDWQPIGDYEFPDTLHDTVFTEAASDERDGYYFNLFTDPVMNEGGTYSLEIGDGGKFKSSWDNDGRATFERGLQYYNSENLTRSVVRKYDGEELTLDYEADFAPEGSAIAGAHGWLNTLGVEYYIIEAWKDWEVPEDFQSLGAVGLNDGIYELYKGPDNPWYSTVYSVRRENKLGDDPHIEGTINLSDHLYAWEKYGISPVDPDYFNFAVRSFSGSGSADITKNIVKINGEDIYQEMTDVPETPGTPETPAPTQPVETAVPPVEGTTSAPSHGFAGSGQLIRAIPGDLNHDQQVDGFDVIFGRRELVKSINGETAMTESDVDLSGETRINDLIIITKLAMGANVKLPTNRAKN